MIKIINQVQTLGIIGLSKNSGKTTTLNAILKLHKDKKIGLTSIGLDGEDIDQVNFLPKPKICVRPKMVVATATTCLEASKVDYKVLEKTNMQTALGNVYIVEVLTDGHMIIAGPTTNKELNDVVDLMKNYVDKIYIDGAFNRMTFASIDLLEGIILAVGAVESPIMSQTIDKTKMIVDFFNLKKSHDLKEIPEAVLIIQTMNKQYKYSDKKIETLKQELSHIDDELDWIYIKGAVTEKYSNLFTRKMIGGFSLICDDPTKLLISQKEYLNIKKLKIDMYTINECPLLCVTINPYSPSGNHYDEKEFLDEMRKALNIPVYNVEKMEEEHVKIKS
ncbi:MAG: hypothetical protein K8Q99_07020 [Acholeplasmataceae bacterium]|nr:hypothetical protein [Acholeplasmataceae bacterium]